MEYIIRLKKSDGKKIYVDPQEEEGFYLYPGEVRRTSLEDGMSLSEEQFFSIYKEYALPRAKKRALALLAKRDMTEKELIEKLEKSQNDSRSIASAMEFVTKNGYVDDENYVRDYLYFRKGRKSYRQLREELKRKGIDQDIIDRVMEEEGEQSIDDIRPLVLKYSRKFEELDEKAIQKICAHFGRKGYRLTMIRDIIEEIKG